MKFKHRRLSEEEKHRVVTGYGKSGETLKECARKAGIGLSTLSLWRRQRARLGRAQLVAVDVVPGEATAGSGSYRVTLPGGVSLEIGHGFKTSELRSILEVVREWR